MLNKHDILFTTIHGSNLYGLAHENSDLDNYIIVADKNGKKVKPQQTIVNNIDTTLIGLSYFMKQIHKGVPQALEALYSPYAEIDLLTWRHNYFCNSSEVVDTYLRTIKSFILDERHDYKYKKHALRLTYNLNDILQQGFFSPVLSDKQIGNILNVPNLTKEEYYIMLKETSVIQQSFLG